MCCPPPGSRGTRARSSKSPSSEGAESLTQKISLACSPLPFLLRTVLAQVERPAFHEAPTLLGAGATEPSHPFPWEANARVPVIKRHAHRPFKPAEVCAELAPFLDRVNSARLEEEKFGEDPGDMSREAEYIEVHNGDDSGEGEGEVFIS